jgi:hypothetical protein
MRKERGTFFIEWTQEIAVATSAKGGGNSSVAGRVHCNIVAVGG